MTRDSYEYLKNIFFCADRPGLAARGDPAGGRLPAPIAHWPHGSHHPGRAAGSQLPGVVLRGLELRHEAHAPVCGGQILVWTQT